MDQIYRMSDALTPAIDALLGDRFATGRQRLLPHDRIHRRAGAVDHERASSRLHGAEHGRQGRARFRPQADRRQLDCARRPSGGDRQLDRLAQSHLQGAGGHLQRRGAAVDRFGLELGSVHRLICCGLRRRNNGAVVSRDRCMVAALATYSNATSNQIAAGAQIILEVDMTDGTLKCSVGATDPGCSMIFWIEATGRFDNAF